ncbi:MAG: hypothetical protein ACRDY4_01220 [Acidimicrobiia bacterium]
MALAADDNIRMSRTDIGGRQIEIVESATTRWLFEPAERRFLRLPRGTALDVSVLAMPWQPYVDRRPADDGRGVVVTLVSGGLLRLNSAP